MKRIAWAFLLFFVLISLIACGGGSSTPPPPPPPSLVVTPSSANVVIGGSQSFTVNATGVTWSITGPGSINQNGIYLAPATFPGVGTNGVTINASAGGQVGHASAAVVFPNDNAGNQVVPVKLGTSGGNVTDNNTANTECCIGTLGSLLQRGTTIYILSNNHVLAKSSFGTAGELIDQPGQLHCPPGSQGLNVATLSEQAALKPTSGTTGPAPSNVDAAIAQIVPGTVDTTGAILDLGAAGATSIAAAAPSSTPISAATAFTAGAHVAKSGRTTGLTCSTLQSVSTDGIAVQYDSSCNGPLAFTSTFSGQVVVAGGTFSAGGDSGSLIVTADTSAPLALLYAGNPTSTIGNPILDSTNSQGGVAKGVLSAFNNGTAPTIVGGAPHPVSCDPTAQVQSAQVGAQSAPVSKEQQQVAGGVRDRHIRQLMASEPAIRSVDVGGSIDSPGQAALVIHVSAAPKTRLSAAIEGVRTRLVYDTGVASPAFDLAEFNRGLSAKDNHRDELLQAGIQGVGVGRSDDAPGESAIVIYTIKGEAHAAIPAVLDGVRTKVVEGERFRASHWNPALESKAGSCTKTQPNTELKTSLK